MEFYFPTELGEQLAFCSAAFTALAGFIMMFAPGQTFRLLGLQDWIYMALGASFAMAAFARIISILSDKGSNLVNYLLLVVQIALAALPLLYVFGFIQT
jgi:hypothetical protein